MVIGIDMDDTICSTNELIVLEADKYDREVLSGSGIKNKDAYEFTEMMGWPVDMKGKFFSDRLEYIMTNAPIKPHAKEVINSLHEKGNKVIIITFRKAKYLSNPYEITKKWLDLNGVLYDKIYADTGSKVDECIESNVDLFIDDKESHCQDVSNANIDVILFTNDYNKNETRFKRCDNWLEVDKYIKEKYNG